MGVFVPYVVAAAARNSHYGTVWRTSLAIGVVFPLALLLVRLRLKEPDEFARESMRRRTLYASISRHVAAFASLYGLFLTLGEFGPGNNIDLLTAKTCATGVRSRYYGIAAAIGKIGAFVGTWVFYIQAAGGSGTVQSAQYPFWVASSLSLLSALIAFCIPDIGQDTTREDARFREYLDRHGWDTSQLGLSRHHSDPVSYAEQQAPDKGE